MTMPPENARTWEHRGIRVLYDPAMGCWRQDPLPPQESLQALYRSRYFQALKPGWDKDQDEDRENLERQYEDKRLNAAELLGPGGGRRILDVGCGNGRLLRYFADRGWTAVGIEPSPFAPAVRERFGIDCRQQFYEDVVLAPHETVDLCHVGDLLEHVLDPHALLAKCRTFLKPGGILCLDQGLDLNPLRLAALDHLGLSPWWIVPEHLTYWACENVEAALGRAGFAVLRKESDFPIDLFLLMGLDFVRDPARGKEAHRMRVEFERALENTGRSDLRRELFRRLASLSLGRSIRFYCRESPR